MRPGAAGDGASRAAAGHRHPPVHLRQHRQSQGRGAHPRQPARQHPRDGQGAARDAGRRVRELAAALPRHGADRRLDGQPRLRLQVPGDVAAHLPVAPRALAARPSTATAARSPAGPTSATSCACAASRTPTSRASISPPGASPSTAPSRCPPRRWRRSPSASRATASGAEAMTPVYGLAEATLGVSFPPPLRGPVLDRVDKDAFMNGGRAVPAPRSTRDALVHRRVRPADSRPPGAHRRRLRPRAARARGRPPPVQRAVGHQRLLPQPGGDARLCCTASGWTPATTATSRQARSTSPAASRT